ncbi:MAG: hypothetical protein ACTHU0_20535 [Kofleriaceae bacterium]
MRTIVAIFVMLIAAPAVGVAQPAGEAAPAAADPAQPVPPAAQPAGEAAPAPAPSAKDLRKTCVDAMNADATFAKDIVEVADKRAAELRLEKDRAQHEVAAAAIAKNEKHVILAYAAMWIIAAAFVLYLWRRQQKLKVEIVQLRGELDAAIKGGK